MQQTINLEDHISDNVVFRTAHETSHNATQLPTPCSFMKQNQFSRYVYRKLKNGKTKLSVVTKDGFLCSAVASNFQTAYAELVQTFHLRNNNI